MLMKAISFKLNVESYFNKRTYQDQNGVLHKIVTNVDVNNNLIRINFNTPDNGVQSIDIPVPFEENGLRLVEVNGIRRAVGDYLLVEHGLNERILDFMDMINFLFFDETNLASRYFIKKGSFTSKLFYGFRNKNLSVIVYIVQKIINDLVYRMPLHETNMNTWAMNRRLTILDQEFDAITTPSGKLEYQINKIRKYFHKGWTSMGLPDGVLADYNYIMKETLRKTIPFGFHFHNPQRNLYQTLGMVGDEKPLIKSKTMDSLEKKGIYRTGWNLFTVFLDIPDVWEDQIMVDKSLCDKFVTREKKVHCYGDVVVQEGQSLENGDTISILKDGDLQRLRLKADQITVKEIKDVEINIGGILEKAKEITLSFRRFIKEGTKITNLAANKGVVRVADLGYAIDPRTGDKRKIDVIVSYKSTEKRKNFTQILEALYNNLTGETETVVDNFIKFEIEELENKLEQAGFGKSGTWECHTYAGKFDAVAGTVFWGVTKDVEDAVWDYGDTIATNSRDLRVSGLKMSTVEFRALRTRFGKNNPLIEEALSYSQGITDIKEMLNILRSVTGIMLPKKQIVNFYNVKPLFQENGIMFDQTMIENSVADEYYIPDGFLMTLPVRYQTTLDKNGEIIYSGIPLPEGSIENEKVTYITDRVYIPNSNLRRCWKHEGGKLGFSEFGNLANTIVSMCHRHVLAPEDAQILNLLYTTISSYFNSTSRALGGKSGNLSTYGMSVRYPYSINGVAVLSNDLPKNTIEIGREMARAIRVSTGDVVLVERFPCLGFMSLRPQKVSVTNDPLCRYTIRVSGNSLGSLSLDHDGDVIYLASFHTNASRELLKKEWTNPNKTCYDAIKEHNNKMGKPHFASATLQDYNIKPFELQSLEEHMSVVEKATSVKSHTGPVTALAYNIMRVIENSDVKDNQKVNVAIEVFLDKVANSVFKQKHGVRSLHEIVTEAICKCDVESLINEGFRRSTSVMICDLIRKKAAETGIKDLSWFYETVTKKKGSTIINRIVRMQNKIYFASRSSLNGFKLLDHLNSEPVDLPSKILKRMLEKGDQIRNGLDAWHNQKLLNQLNTRWAKNMFISYSDLIDKFFGVYEGEGDNQCLTS